MKKNEYIIKYLKILSDKLITHYLRNNFHNESQIEEEIERVHEIIEKTKISIENYIPGTPTRALNCREKGIIILYVNDKNNISQEELNNFIVIIIHEFYHSISKVIPKRNNEFLEEGYVTEITAETLRYAMNNPIEIGNKKKEELLKILKGQELKNAYQNSSEFVRSTQIIMQKFGYNAMFEYMFSENGIERLCEIAQKISPEFEKIIKKQNKKNTRSINYVYEKNFFIKMFKEIDFSEVSETNIEMNRLLQKYLTDEGLIYKNQRLYDIVSKYNQKYVSYNEFYKENNGLSRNKLFSKIKETIDICDFEYQTQNNRIKDAKRMIEIMNKEYVQSAIKPSMFHPGSYLAKLISYDMYQRGLQRPTYKDIEEYSNYLVYDLESEKIIFDMVNSEYSTVYNECKNREENLSNFKSMYC